MSHEDLFTARAPRRYAGPTVSGAFESGFGFHGVQIGGRCFNGQHHTVVLQPLHTGKRQPLQPNDIETNEHWSSRPQLNAVFLVLINSLHMGA